MRERPDRSPARWITFGLAFVGALVVAELAVLALAPRGGLIEHDAVSPSSYFSPAELQRARDFRRPQLAVSLSALAVQLAVLGWLSWRPPRRMPRRAVVAGAAVSLSLAVAALPLSAMSRERSVEVGLATQSWGAWSVDKATSAAIGAVLAGAVAGVLMLLLRRLPRAWWVAGAAVVVMAGVAFVYAGPAVLDPAFNRFEPLPPGETRTDVLQLARRAGVDVGEVYVMDASRRTTAANAYVTGLGSTKRVVLYDTLIDSGFTRREVRLVVAHELAHVSYRDVPKALLYLAIVAPAGMFAVSRARPTTVPALWLALVAVSTPMLSISNGLSREVEARADAFSLRLTCDPEAFVSFQRRIAVRNVTDPDPLDLTRVLLRTHPTTTERIGIAEAFRDREPCAGG